MASFLQKACINGALHGNSNIQNVQKLDPLEITAKKFQAKIG
jgi:hypothetical protein